MENLNLAPTCGLKLAAKSVVEQARLIRRLKQIPLAGHWG
jgi:hypothetical protein